jgi:energy-converting hydrogenase Eha subunit E
MLLGGRPAEMDFLALLTFIAVGVIALVLYMRRKPKQ